MIFDFIDSWQALVFWTLFVGFVCSMYIVGFRGMLSAFEYNADNNTPARDVTTKETWMSIFWPFRFFYIFVHERTHSTKYQWAKSVHVRDTHDEAIIKLLDEINKKIVSQHVIAHLLTDTSDQKKSLSY